MSIFGRIIPFQDLVARVPQLESQLVKLESEESSARADPQKRIPFIRSCNDLKKQISEHKKKVEHSRPKEGLEEQKVDTISKLEELQNRMSKIVMDREKISDERGKTNETDGRSIHETPVLVTSPRHDEESDDEERLARMRGSSSKPAINMGKRSGRRVSIMYDDDTDDEEDEQQQLQILQNTVQQKHQISKKPPTRLAPIEEQGSSQKIKEENKVEQQQGTLEILEERKAEIENADEMKEEEEIVGPDPFPFAQKKVDGNQFEVLADLSAEKREDLTIFKGEILKIEKTRPDGWWTARNTRSQIGLVPKTYLRHFDPKEQKSKEKTKIVAATEKESMLVVNKEEKKEEIVRKETTPESFERKEFNLLPPRTPALPHRNIQSHAPRSSPIPPLAMTSLKPCRSLGDALRRDEHLSNKCHITPRLSHSNIGFHDLHWNFADDKLRKRHVRCSRVVRLVRLEGMPIVEGGCPLIRAALYDRSKKTGRQIVSNVHTVRARVNNNTWNFMTRPDSASGVEYGDFLLRSNYKSPAVVLVIEATIAVKKEDTCEEKSLGIFELPIIGEDGKCSLQNKTYAQFLSNKNIFDIKESSSTTAMKMILKIVDVAAEILPLVDSLPDVLLFNPMYVRLAYFFRRRAGTVLIRDRENKMSAEMVSDPLLAVFPAIVDQFDMMDLLRNLWNVRFKTVKNKSEVEQATSFFHIFMNTAYCIHQTAFLPDYCIYDPKALANRQEVFSKCVRMLQEYKTSARFLLTQSCKPINIFDYSFDLLGPHALD